MTEPEPETPKRRKFPPPPGEVVKRMGAKRREMREKVESRLPPAFLEHRRNARREMLLAMRSLVDAAIERLDKP